MKLASTLALAVWGGAEMGVMAMLLALNDGEGVVFPLKLVYTTETNCLGWFCYGGNGTTR